MTRRTTEYPVIAPLVVAVVLAAAGLVLAQEAAEAAGTEMDPAMAAWMELAVPGDHHRHLAQQAGNWKADGTFWMAPDGPPTKAAGTLKAEMILDGRFLRMDYTGDFMGSTFRGMGLDGYDNQTGKHTGMWVDTMGTMMATYEGTCESDGKVRTMHTQFVDPLTDDTVKLKAVTTLQGPDKFTYEAWEMRKGAEPRKTAEIVFTRQG